MTTTQTRTQNSDLEERHDVGALSRRRRLAVASGAIHLHLWDLAYRHVKTLNALFLVQAIGTFVAAIVLLVTRHFLIAAGCALLMAGTIVGFLLAKTVGIFGFKLPYITTEAWIVLVIEAVAVSPAIYHRLAISQAAQQLDRQSDPAPGLHGAGRDAADPRSGR